MSELRPVVILHLFGIKDWDVENILASLLIRQRALLIISCM